MYQPEALHTALIKWKGREEGDEDNDMNYGIYKYLYEDILRF